jgi:hypothetical protein
MTAAADRVTYWQEKVDRLEMVQHLHENYRRDYVAALRELAAARSGAKTEPSGGVA